MTKLKRLDALDSVRGIAALYVYIHHLGITLSIIAYPSIRKFFIFGQAAVMAFFILSGFVIYYSTYARGYSFSFKGYFIRRFRRIYPPILVALFLAWLCNVLIYGNFYQFRVTELIGNLLMLGDKPHPGQWFDLYFGNHPVWSLSYEWFFYMLFGLLAIKIKPTVKYYDTIGLIVSIFGIFSYVLFPNQLSLFCTYTVIWWSGLVLAKEYLTSGRCSFKSFLIQILYIGLVAAVWLGHIYINYEAFSLRGAHPFIVFRHLITTGILLAIAYVGQLILLKRAIPLFMWFKKLAPISYALYIFHLPLILLWKHYHIKGMAFIEICVLTALLFLLSYLVEVKLQRFINKYVFPIRRK